MAIVSYSRGFGTLFFLPQVSLAATIPPKCPPQITSCGCIIENPGAYHVASALTEPSETEDCITVNTISVLYLDGNGITSTAPTSDQQNSNGIHLTRKADGAIVVGGDAAIMGFTSAILVEDVGANIGGFRASHNDNGLFINFAKNVTAYNFDVSGNAAGIQILHSTHVSLSNFLANNTTSDGVFMSGVADSQLISFQASSSPGSGLYIEEGGCNYVLTACRDLNSQHNRIFGGTIVNNGFTGISLAYFLGLRGGSDYNQIIGNRLRENVNGDLDEQNLGCGHNLWVGNTFDTASRDCVH